MWCPSVLKPFWGQLFLITIKNFIFYHIDNLCSSFVVFLCCFLVLFLCVVVIPSHCWSIVLHVADVNIIIGPLHYLCYCWFITLLMLFMVCHIATSGASCCIVGIIVRLSLCQFIVLLVLLLVRHHYWCYYWFIVLLVSCQFVTLLVLLLVHHITSATCYVLKYPP